MKNFLTFLLGVFIFAGIYWFVFHKTPEVRTFEKNLLAAKQGDSQAMLQVGIAYEQGTGTKPDKDQAIDFYRQAASAGNTAATYRLAQVYEEGVLVPQDLEEAFVYYQLAASQGNAQAQTALSRFYKQPLGSSPQSDGEALLWLIRAAKQDEPAALQSIEAAQEQRPELYQEVLAFSDLFDKTVQEQDPQDAFSLAKFYRSGTLIARNDEEAFRLFKMAWEKDNTLSQAAVEMAEMYLLGEGVEKDENKALELYVKAAELQNPQAQYFLGKRSYEETSPNYKDAFAWFSNAAEQGYAPAQYMTGYMLLQGQGTGQSYKLAVDFFTKAADQDYASAQYVLGQMYWKGLGVKKNIKTGRSWLEKAAANGNASAQAFLAD